MGELRQQGVHYCSLFFFFGQQTDDRTRPTRERFSTQKTLPPAGTDSRCRRNHFIAGGNTKSKSLSCGGEQPWHVLFCRIHRREQSGSSLGPGDRDLADSETDTAIPDDDIASLASYESVQPSSL